MASAAVRGEGSAVLYSLSITAPNVSGGLVCLISLLYFDLYVLGDGA